MKDIHLLANILVNREESACTEGGMTRKKNWYIVVPAYNEDFE